MRFKRDEGFRFSFGTPLAASFAMDEMNGVKARLIDLSPNGMKLSTQHDIPKSEPNASNKISVRFTLHEMEHQIQGQIIWKQKAIDGYFYGIQFSQDKKDQEEMIRDLKQFAKRQYSKNN
ncbi:hypothetical protein J2Z40_000939 [Cytobacillus eiseniae]|uniref:PilZ domain-containing protein n=1 Tax=Cytobacillus eiseniae TaxID=762947 RepID=A0ABS4RBV8_9BACI|nr:PilZ domain-containing protein [Cytobacillus eiseniae]MBP2240384.1 hypothetical protein [Cytobacillus eiseniae]